MTGTGPRSEFILEPETYRLFSELLIKTTHLLLAVERTLIEQSNSTGGKAMIFGSFVERNIPNT